MRTRPAPDPPYPDPPVDPWVAHVTPGLAGRRAPYGPAGWARRPDVGLTVRADAAVWAAAGLADVRGRPVRALAVCVDHGGGVDVLLSAPAVPPAGWRAHGDDPCRVRVPAAVAFADPAGSFSGRVPPVPVVLACATPDGRPVHVDVAAVAALAVPADALGPVAVALLASPLAVGLDVVVGGVDPAALPPRAAHGPGRLHLAPDGATAAALACALAGDDEPVVLVARAAGPGVATADPVALLRAGVAVVTDAAARPVRWRLAPCPDRGAAWILAPTGWPVATLLTT